MNEHRNCNDFAGFHRSFDWVKWKYSDEKNILYELELYKNGQFRLSVNRLEHCYKFGRGRWKDVGDFIILDFNEFERNRQRRELEESLMGYTTIKGMCMVLKKKGRKDLRILSSNAVLKSGY